MKLSINTSFTENTSSQFLLILVDSENTQHLANAYQINDLNNLIEATQFKAAFNETLSLIGQIPTSPNTALVGVGKAAELQAAKLVKIAQTIIKASQKKFKHISLDLSALPAELHYLFALSLTQAAYAFDEFKSKKADNVLEQISLISAQSPLNAAQLKLIEAVQSGQSFARDLGNRPGNICFPEYLAEQALELAAQYPDLLRVNVEKAMLPTTRFGGHIVSGHVDAVGEITVVREDARSLYFEVTAPAEIARYLAEKGSITVDGISLTINHLRGRILSLNLIPHTAERTNIGTWKAGSQVNLEVDVLARYIERLMMGDKAAETTPQSKISLDFLAQNGFLK